MYNLFPKAVRFVVYIQIVNSLSLLVRRRFLSALSLLADVTNRNFMRTISRIDVDLHIPNREIHHHKII